MKVSQDIIDFQKSLCKKYDFKCFTKKCPLREIGCYEQSIRQTLGFCNVTKRKEYMAIVKKAMASEGWKSNG